MRIIRPVLLPLLIALLPLPALAAPIHDRPALWKLADEDTTIWLFGTIHLLGPHHDWLRGPVAEAFHGASELSVETQIPEPAAAQEVIVRRAIDPEGKPLSAIMPPALHARLAKRMADYGMPLAQLETAEPWYIAMTLQLVALQRLGLTSTSGVDVTLLTKAAQDGKAIVPLEGFEEQIAFLDTLPAPLQLALLETTLDEADKGSKMTAKLIRDWSRGNIAALARMINHDLEKLEPLRAILIGQRNARWATWIAGRMEKPGTVFLAVGAGHLGGDGNVRALLEAKGFKVERVQ